MIIELLHDPIKFRSILIKPYFIDKQEPISDSPTSIQVLPAEVPPTKISPPETSQTETNLANITLIEPAAKSPLAILAFQAPVKQTCRQPKKYPKQANIAAPSDICFLINEFNIFINKNSDKHLA